MALDNKNFHHIQTLFETVAEKYEWMNCILSGGQQDKWRRHFVEMLPLRPHNFDPKNSSGKGLFQTKQPPWVYIDMACGGGEIGKGVLERLQEIDLEDSKKPFVSKDRNYVGKKLPATHRKLFFCDPNPAMQKEGKKRLFHQSPQDDIHWVSCRGEKIPFKDCSVNLYTTAFGMRNMVDLKKALHEAWRVLKPGGWFYCLELSMPTDPIIRALYDPLLNIVPWIGYTVVGQKEPYQYLADSIRQFPSPEAFQALLNDVGFQTVPHKPFSLGIVTIFGGQKCAPLHS